MKEGKITPEQTGELELLRLRDDGAKEMKEALASLPIVGAAPYQMHMCIGQDSLVMRARMPTTVVA